MRSTCGQLVVNLRPPCCCCWLPGLVPLLLLQCAWLLPPGSFSGLLSHRPRPAAAPYPACPQAVCLWPPPLTPPTTATPPPTYPMPALPPATHCLADVLYAALCCTPTPASVIGSIGCACVRCRSPVSCVSGRTLRGPRCAPNLERDAPRLCHAGPSAAIASPCPWPWRPPHPHPRPGRGPRDGRLA